MISLSIWSNRLGSAWLTIGRSKTRIESCAGIAAAAAFFLPRAGQGRSTLLWLAVSSSSCSSSGRSHRAPARLVSPTCPLSLSFQARLWSPERSIPYSQGREAGMGWHRVGVSRCAVVKAAAGHARTGKCCHRIKLSGTMREGDGRNGRTDGSACLRCNVLVQLACCYSDWGVAQAHTRGRPSQAHDAHTATTGRRPGGRGTLLPCTRQSDKVVQEP